MRFIWNYLELLGVTWNYLERIFDTYFDTWPQSFDTWNRQYQPEIPLKSNQKPLFELKLPFDRPKKS